MLKNSANTYGLLSKSLHWIVAATVFTLFGVGVWMVELDYYSSWYQVAPYYHKSTGVFVGILTLFRLFWRIISVEPQALSTHAIWERKIAKLTHWTLYALIVMIVSSGYLISTADGRGIEVFGLFEIPALTLPIENQEDIAGLFHQWLAYALIILVGLHAIAAIKHHWIDRDETLKRMI